MFYHIYHNFRVYLKLKTTIPTQNIRDKTTTLTWHEKPTMMNWWLCSCISFLKIAYRIVSLTGDDQWSRSHHQQRHRAAAVSNCHQLTAGTFEEPVDLASMHENVPCAGLLSSVWCQASYMAYTLHEGYWYINEESQHKPLQIPSLCT